MKTTFAILFSISCMTLVGQNHSHVLVADTVQWNYLSDTWCYDCLSTLIFQAYGDTIINDTLYRELYMTKEGNPEPELWGFIHEDTSKSQIIMLSYTYYCQDTPCVKNVIYDMNLELGDTLMVYSYDETDYNIVSSIDTLSSATFFL